LAMALTVPRPVTTTRSDFICLGWEGATVF
jgi:hypothetical protein